MSTDQSPVTRQTRPGGPRELGDPGAIPGVAVDTGSRSKALLVLGVGVVCLLSVAGVVLGGVLKSGKADGAAEARKSSVRPVAAGNAMPPDFSLPPKALATEPPKVEVPAPSPQNKAPEEAKARPIPLRGESDGSAGMNKKAAPPEDAPVMLSGSGKAIQPDANAVHGTVEPAPSAPAEPALDRAASDEKRTELARRKAKLDDLRNQAQAALSTLTAVAARTAPAPGAVATPQATPPGTATMRPANSAASLFGSLEGSATTSIHAEVIANRSLTLPKGTVFTCALKTRVVSAVSGMIACQVLRDVYSDDGRVVLIERGSHLDGEYRMTQIRPGLTRIPALWTRVRTPAGVVAAINSGATGALGEAGLDAHVDNRWPERIGAALMLSIIDDIVKYAVNQAADGAASSTVVLGNTTSTSSKLAEKVLETTINLPPLMYANQGEVVGIYVANDVDFSTVYALAPVAP